MSGNNGFQVGVEITGNKERTQVYQTIQKTHLGRGLSNIVQHGAALIETIVSTAISNVDSTITLPANSAVVGNIVQNKTTGFEFNVIEVDGDIVSVEVKKGKSIIGTVGDSFAVKRFVMSQLNKDGAIEVVSSQGPTKFLLDAAAVDVSENTGTPASTIPLPTKILDDAGLNVSIPISSIDGKLSLGQSASADSTAVVLSTEQEVILDAIKSAVEAKGSLGYIDGQLIEPSVGTPLATGVGTAYGTIATATYKVQIQNQASPLRVTIGGNPVGYVLAGAEFDIECSGLTGELRLISETGSDITSGKIALNFLG